MTATARTVVVSIRPLLVCETLYMIVYPAWRSCFRQNFSKFFIHRKNVALRHISGTSDLPSATENARSDLSKSMTARLDKLQTSILFAGQRLNDLTGYSGIERLKKKIEYQEQGVLDSVQRVREAKRAYEEAIRTRSESQKEVNELLQRKNSWSQLDLERFTTLFRNDHTNSQNEILTQDQLTEAEDKAEQARANLGSMILARYHEEQIWSDKIRRASTWGTWGLMGFNIFLFIIVQLALEPWKRARLVNNFEEKVRQVVQEERGPIASIVNGKEDQSFLTDADHAAAGYDHDSAIRVGFESAYQTTLAPRPDGNNSSPAASLNYGRSMEAAKGLEDPTDLQTSFELSERLNDLATPTTSLESSSPRTSNFSMLSLPSSLQRLTHSYPVKTLMASLKYSLSGATTTVRSLLSEQQSSMRVEDVTISCFISAVIGIGIGMAIRTS